MKEEKEEEDKEEHEEDKEEEEEEEDGEKEQEGTGGYKEEKEEERSQQIPVCPACPANVYYPTHCTTLSPEAIITVSLRGLICLLQQPSPPRLPLPRSVKTTSGPFEHFWSPYGEEYSNAVKAKTLCLNDGYRKTVGPPNYKLFFVGTSQFVDKRNNNT